MGRPLFSSSLILFGLLLVVNCQSNVFTRNYTGYKIPETGDLELERFISSLSAFKVVVGITVTQGNRTYSCNRASAAAKIVNNLQSRDAGNVVCGENIWRTGGCCGYSLEINGAHCACNQAFAVRTGASCGANWGGITCPPLGGIVKITIANCGDKVVTAPELCDGGQYCSPSDCTCKPGTLPSNSINCTTVNLCQTFKSNDINLASCTQPDLLSRNYTCKPGYSAVGAPNQRNWIVLRGNTPFDGCVARDYCADPGYSGRPQNTASCSFTTATNSRTVTCVLGYFAKAPDSLEITLNETQTFTGCKLIDTCKTYGMIPNAERCESYVGFRRVYCRSGFGVGKPTTPPTYSRYTDLYGKDDGNNSPCTDIRECLTYGFGPYLSLNTTCEEPSVGYRRITCPVGSFAEGVTNSRSIDLRDETGFAGCTTVSNACTVAGYSGKVDYTLDCNATATVRTITCVPGYWVSGTSSRSVTLNTTAPFPGCVPFNQCVQFGPQPNATNWVASCVTNSSIPIIRTVTCATGYHVNGTQNVGYLTASTLLNGERFPGCVFTPQCVKFPPSPSQNVARCEAGLNNRTYVCSRGYYARGYPGFPTQVTLTGETRFAGCVDINECTAFGYNGNTVGASKCTNVVTPARSIGERVVSCLLGYSALAGTFDSFITLVGNTSFPGCNLINNCNRYPTPAYATCEPSTPNTRIITCNPGYYLNGTVNVISMTITGNLTVPTCLILDVCAAYSTPNPNYSCTRVAPNIRNVTCRAGYTLDVRNVSRLEVVLKSPDNINTQVLTGSRAGAGCVPLCGDGIRIGGEGCDDGNTEDDDGCSAECTVEDGWYCGDDGSCCPSQNDIFQYLTPNPTTKITCSRGVWNFNTGTTNGFLIDPKDGWEETLPSGYGLCGDFIIGHDLTDEDTDEFDSESIKEREPTITIYGTLVISGTVRLLESAVIAFSGPDAKLVIAPHCSGRIDTVGLSMNWTSQINIVDVDYKDSADGPSDVIQLYNCPKVNGFVFLNATNIPPAYSNFNLITFNKACKSENVYGDPIFSMYSHQLPGGCSNIDGHFEKGKDDELTSAIQLETRRARLCTGQIIGIIFGVVGGVLLVIVALVIVMTGSGGSDDGYTTF